MNSTAYQILNSTTFVNSTILTEENGKSLLNLIGFSSTLVLGNLYRGSRDGFEASKFHSKCDSSSGTLTIIKTSNGNIFGGFTTENWSGYYSSKTDSSAFIFSLINKYNYPVKLNNTLGGSNAIYSDPSYGPTFGGGHDFYISGQSNINTNSYSSLGYSYQLPFTNFTYGSTAAQSFLAGSYNFQTLEIEVYSIDGN